MQIKDKRIIKLINSNVAELEDINQQQLQLNKRIEALGKKNQEFVDLMNKVYGWGNWNNVDAKNLTFTPREEFEKAYYIIQNPAVRDKVEVDDINLQERTVMNDAELCKAVDRIIAGN